MIKFIRNNYHYFILFIFIFLSYSVFAYTNNYGDPMANYGFSYGITRGLLPYINFNTISTPLYAFVMSIGLFVWNNYTMFLLEQSLLVTIMFYLLNKVYGKKAYILLFVISIFLFLGINATYNFFTFFIMVLLLFLEKKYPDKDYIIGIVIGFAILSKHTVGILFVLPSLIYYFRKKDKLLKRFFGIISVGFIFIFYLFMTNSFTQFIDLCLLGLFDFSSKNGRVFNALFIISIILFIISIIITFKRKNDISNYYLVLGISFLIPLFDFCHFSIYIMCFMLQLLPFISKKENYLGFLSFILSVLSAIMIFIIMATKFDATLSSKLNHFEYLINDKNNYEITVKYFKYFDKYPNALILSYSKMQYDISRNKDIDYFDVILYGNFGYDGSNKMINKIEKMHKIYIILDKRGYYDKSKVSQFDKSIANHVVTNYEKVEEVKHFIVYYKD